jgi:hypothetical protein
MRVQIAFSGEMILRNLCFIWVALVMKLKAGNFLKNLSIQLSLLSSL